ncbi:hypothetical protein Mgra_00006213 [Meloidogyne graminicola]|uniref:Uncharacterized protein n=1 Tax=Meloidogyne graminicola TaxID=189291 RepID=A0A8S9ZMH3_9BILA|nr:hypothetical protein Mgra_00006213 [Meloidogyne graminicola]
MKNIILQLYKLCKLIYQVCTILKIILKNKTFRKVLFSFVLLLFYAHYFFSSSISIFSLFFIKASFLFSLIFISICVPYKAKSSYFFPTLFYVFYIC